MNQSLKRPEASSRRPIADLFRRTADRATQWCVGRRIRPNTISYLSIAFAALAAGCFALGAEAPMLLILGTLCCVIRLWLNMLDGMVAVAAGLCSPWGEVVNELPDRVSDVLIFSGVAISGLCRPDLALAAATSAVFVAYAGTLGQAVGAGRQFGGWMSKPNRMVMIGLAALWTARLLKAPAAESRLFLDAFSWTAFDVALVIIVLGCLQTIAVRVRTLFLQLHRAG